MLSLLKIQIEEIAERVRCCEEELLKEYNRTREKLVLEVFIAKLSFRRRHSSVKLLRKFKIFSLNQNGKHIWT